MLSSKISINKEEFNLLRNYIQKECGILVNEDKAYLIESRLARLVVKTGCKNFKEFYLKIKSDTTKKLRGKVIDSMTTNETLWFRDKKPWTVIKEKIIPSFIDELQKNKKQNIKIWSAACSTGQEPYSLAMLLHEALRFKPELLSRIKILATDISPSALYMGISGRYNNIAMSRGLPTTYKTKYFKSEGPISTISDDIKKMVKFKKFNLQNPFTRLPNFDMIFCRNVAIYFSKSFKIQLFNKIHKKLNRNNSYFLIGSTETLMGYSEEFEQKEFKNSIYYEPKK